MHFERHLQPVSLGGSALIKGSCWRSRLNKSESRANVQKLALPDSFTPTSKGALNCERLGMYESHALPVSVMPPSLPACSTDNASHRSADIPGSVHMACRGA